jgi:hypothetical protein
MRVSPWQAAKVFAVLYFMLGVAFSIVLSLLVLLQPVPVDQLAPRLNVVVAVLAPFAYALGGLVFALLASVAFNFVVKLVGGLEFDVAEVPERV